MVSGNVQGVCYRHYVAKKAKELGIRGFVRNLADGHVEIEAEGEDKRVEAFFVFCKNNPGYSAVKDAEIKEEKEITKPFFHGFEIR